MDGHVECGFGQIPKNQRGKYAQLPFVETFKQKRKKTQTSGIIWHYLELFAMIWNNLA